MHTSNTASISETDIPRLILTTGEPAGIGPDLIIAVAGLPFAAQLVCLTDPELLRQRAAMLSRQLDLVEYDPRLPPVAHKPGTILYITAVAAKPVTAGRPSRENALFVLDTIRDATRLCLKKEFAAMITAPVNKAVINESGHNFTGHTEYIAGLCGVKQPVMMLMNRHMRVALVTTHLPLSQVSAAVSRERLEHTLQIVNTGLQTRLGIAEPRILVCGLNPHAGESGHLGTEEIETIIPVVEKLKASGLNLTGPVPADTAFTRKTLAGFDVVVSMYHDQGLPVLKSHGFGATVNVTLGLPIIRTSVDHGTALDLAGTGQADAGSLCAAIEAALAMVKISARSLLTA